MTSIRFGRKYRILFAKKPEEYYYIPSSVVKPQLIDRGATPSGIPVFNGDYYDFGQIPSRFWEITDEGGKGLDFKTTIHQNKTTSTPIKIEFKNLEDAIVQQITKDDTIIIQAGYAQSTGRQIDIVGANEAYDRLSTLLVAQVADISTIWDGKDHVTSVVCGEALTVSKNAKISKSYSPFTPRIEVLNDMLGMLQSAGVPTAPVNLGGDPLAKAIVETPFAIGYVAKGKLMEEIQTLAESMNLRVYTILGKVYVDSLFAPDTKLIFKVTPDNVIGIPQPATDNLTTASNSHGNRYKKNLKITVWLDGRVSLNKGVQLEGFEGFIDGYYKIESISHRLHFRSKSLWLTDLTLNYLE